MFITKVQPVSLMHRGPFIHRSGEKQYVFEIHSCIPFLQHWKINRPKRINVAVNNLNRMSHFCVQKLYNSKRVNLSHMMPHILQRKGTGHRFIMCSPSSYISQIFPSLPFHQWSRHIFPFRICGVVHDVSRRQIH